MADFSSRSRFVLQPRPSRAFDGGTRSRFARSSLRRRSLEAERNHRTRTRPSGGLYPHRHANPPRLCRHRRRHGQNVGSTSLYHIDPAIPPPLHRFHMVRPVGTAHAHQYRLQNHVARLRFRYFKLPLRLLADRQPQHRFPTRHRTPGRTPRRHLALPQTAERRQRARYGGIQPAARRMAAGKGKTAQKSGSL